MKYRDRRMILPIRALFGCALFHLTYWYQEIFAGSLRLAPNVGKGSSEGNATPLAEAINR
jgi:hypothetical protein